MFERFFSWLASKLSKHIYLEALDTVNIGIRNHIATELASSRTSSPVKDKEESETIAAVGVDYTLFDNKREGFIGGLISLYHLNPGDAVEISVYVYEPDHSTNSFRYTRYQRTKIEGTQQNPMLTIDETFMPYGGKVVMTQVEGQPKRFWYSVYRR